MYQVGSVRQLFGITGASFTLALVAVILSAAAFLQSISSSPSQSLLSNPDSPGNARNFLPEIIRRTVTESQQPERSQALIPPKECPPPPACPPAPLLLENPSCPKCAICTDYVDGEEKTEGGVESSEERERRVQNRFENVNEKGDVENILETGAWKFNESYVYPFDAPLASLLNTILRGKTVLELGAGTGHYTRAFAEDARIIHAYDGAEGIEKLTGGYIQQADLTQHLNLGLHEWVVCMEVGEHVPQEFELSVIDNIHRHNTEGVILSWAILGQNGIGHVNNHSNQYIKRLMRSLGYRSDVNAERQARKAASLWWFQKSTMIFRRVESPLR